MAVKRDYYEVLGVSKNASAQEIEQGYRKLAVQYHPDRVAADKKEEAREKFKEISEAYAVLSDANKKAQYDRFGHAGIDSRYTQEDIFRNVDFGSIFEDSGVGASVFGDLLGDIFGASSGRGRHGPMPTRGADVEYPLKITLEESFVGVDKTINIYTTQTCTVCQGSGAKPGTGKKTCPECRGAGKVKYTQGFFMFTQTCSKCSGMGQVAEQFCPECRGRGKVKKSSKITVKIPAGVDSGTSIRIREKGEAGELGGPPGDLYVTIRIEQNSKFQRRGDDLFCEVEMTFTQAVLGGEIEVPTLDGNIKMRVPAGTPSGKTFRLKDKGMPNLHRQSRGNLYVTSIVQVPTKLSEKQKHLLREFANLSGEKIEGTDSDKNFINRMFGENKK